MSYLLLKDIFPQNAVDLGMLTKDGLKGFLYRSFREKEKDLYRISDYIGCMSPANVRYVIEHNPEVDPAIVEIAPNSYDVPSEIPVEYKDTAHIRQNMDCLQISQYLSMAAIWETARNTFPHRMYGSGV